LLNHSNYHQHSTTQKEEEVVKRFSLCYFFFFFRFHIAFPREMFECFFNNDDDVLRDEFPARESSLNLLE